MIYVDKANIEFDSFVSLLETTKNKIEENYSTATPKGINGNIFETIVYEQMKESATGSDFNGHIEQTGAHGFPDIIAKRLYGVEVKMTIGDKWTSTGNSILETTRIDDVSTIFMFFGKFGKGCRVKYRKYQECLYDVGVTHSPRYKIDMDLESGKSIFDKIGIEYDIFRNDIDSIKKLKNYYRAQLKPGQELWWIDPTSQDSSVSPIIQSLKLLNKNVRNQFICESFILFPEILGSSRLKFERVAAYLITDYNAVTSSLRDSFSAGGKVKMQVKGKSILVPKITAKLRKNAKNIFEIIRHIPKEKLSYYWGEKVTRPPIEVWLELLQTHYGSKIVRDIFEDGIRDN